MAYDIQRLEEGLVKADAAGDSIAAKAFADEIRRMRAETPVEPPVEAIEPSLSDKALSYGASALSGVTALPRGTAQLGWNIGEEINKLAFPTTYGEGMELTPYAEERLLASGGKLPEYKDPEFLPEWITIKGQQAVVDALKEKAGREGFDWTELAGMIASPASLMKTGIAKSPTFMGKVGEGAKVSGLYGTGMPVTGEGDFPKKKVEQALLSFVTGGASPILGKAISKPAEYVKEFVKPFTQKGIVSDVEKFVREKFGSGRDKIVAALRDAKEGETSAQAIARANLEARRAGKPSSFGSQIAATEKDLAMKAEGGDPLKSIYERQAAARERDIGRIAGTKEEYKGAVAKRAEDADVNYQKAFDESVTLTKSQNPYMLPAIGKPVKTRTGTIKTTVRAEDAPMNPYMLPGKKLEPEYKFVQKAYKSPTSQSVVDLLKGEKGLSRVISSSYAREAINSAERVFASKGLNPKENIVQFLHHIKKGLDDQLERSGEKALDKLDKDAVMGVKGQLIKWLNEKSPKYEEARLAFQAASDPIDRMKVGKELQKGLRSAAEEERALPFLTAIEEAPKTLKRATGFKGYDELSDVLKPQEVSIVKRIAEELKQEGKRKKMAAEGESMLPKLSGEIEFSLPHILSRPIVVANTVLKAIAIDKTPEYRAVLSEIMKDPKRLEQILMRPENSRTKEIAMDILNQISKAAPMAAAQAAGEQ